MNGVQCLYSPQHALYRVFISPTARLAVGSLASRQLFRAAQPPSAIHAATGSHYAARTMHRQQQLRGYAGMKPSRRNGPRVAEAMELESDEDRGFDRRYTTQKDIDRSGRSRPPQDHEITDPQIMVIDNGASEGPLLTEFVLTKLDAGESLRMIRPYVPANSEKDTPPEYAICKIVDKKAEFERRKELKEKKAASGGKAKTKELELTWGIGTHDLATKMRKMSEFFAKGMKVEVTVGRKKGGRKVGGDEAEDLVKKVREEMEAHGGREAKPATGQVGGTMKLYLEGAAQKQ